MMNILTLTSDFGLSDSYVAQMKGAALTVNTKLNMLDLCHDIPAHDIAIGSRIFAEATSTFPPGSVHVAVVDPGVGTDRRRLILQTHIGDSYDNQSSYFVGPDNGLLLRAAPKHRIRAAWEINKVEIFGKISGTFEGRDIFAPVGAHIASGDDIATFATPIDDLASIIDAPRKAPQEEGSNIVAEIDYIDRFGNAVTNLHISDIASPAKVSLQSQTQTEISLSDSYQNIKQDSLGLIIGSQGYYELACNEKSAAKLFSLQLGDKLEVAR